MAPISGCTVNPARQEADGIIELEFWSLQMLSFKDYMTAYDCRLRDGPSQYPHQVGGCAV
ncbi:MAG: hypothetical protein R2857_08020 [Vampirovibrionales bacterium]